jgi:type I restriction enzyme, S subunit
VSEVAFGRTVRLATERSTTRSEFRIGLEAVEKGTGRLSFDPDVQYDGDGIRFRRGDVLFGKLRPNLRKVWLADTDGDAVGDFHVYRPIPALMSSRYLAYLVLSEPFLSPVIASVLGAKMPRADWGEVRNIKVWVPALDKQRAIADYLDRETAQIDAFIAKNEELIKLLTERRASEISHAIGGGWPEVQLRTLSTLPIQNGVDAIGDSSNPREWPRYVRTTDIVTMSSLDDEKRVSTAPGLAVGSMVQKDDLLLTRAGATIGKSYLHNSDEVASYAGYLVRVRPDFRRVLPWYLAYWTQSQQYLNQVRSGAVISTIENFSASKYRALRVPLPPIDVQAEVVERIRRLLGRVDSAVGMAASATELARERRAALISAAVTGMINGEMVA